MEHPANTLAGLCALGGIIGYARKGSVPSLVGGLAVGAVYGYAGYLLKQNRNGGIEMALLGSVLLLGAGLPRAIKVQKPMPIALTAVALLSLTYYGKKWVDFNT